MQSYHEGLSVFLSVQDKSITAGTLLTIMHVHLSFTFSRFNRFVGKFVQKRFQKKHYIEKRSSSSYKV